MKTRNLLEFINGINDNERRVRENVEYLQALLKIYA